jgi:asparagine synthase (glutamine-hydrolysing)
VANAVGLRQESFLAADERVESLFADTWRAFDEPFADSSALPMLLLCREVARRVTVAIGGDGGDEVWCGYPWQRALYRAESLAWIPQVARTVGSLAAGSSNSQRGYMARVVAARDRLERWTVLKTGLTIEAARFLPVNAEHRPPSEVFAAAAAALTNIKDPLDWATRMDLLTYLPDDLMVKADRASMDVGLELREPLLNCEFVNWGLSLPIAARFNYNLRQGKQPARAYLRSRLSADLLKRPKKGFTPPLGVWLNGALKELCLDALARLTSGDLAPMVLPGPCKNWTKCAERLGDRHHQFLWRVLCFSGWLKSSKNSPSPETVAREHPEFAARSSR